RSTPRYADARTRVIFDCHRKLHASIGRYGRQHTKRMKTRRLRGWLRRRGADWPAHAQGDADPRRGSARNDPDPDGLDWEGFGRLVPLLGNVRNVRGVLRLQD